MRKFTVFTIILTIIIVVVVAEIVVNEYLPTLASSGEGKFEFTLPENLDLSKSIATNVLGTQQSTGGLNNRLGSASAKSPETSAKVSKLSSDLHDENNFYLDNTQLSDEILKDSQPIEIIPKTEEKDPETETAKSVELFTNPEDDLEETIFEESDAKNDLSDFEETTPGSSALSTVTVYIRDDHVRNAGFSDAFLEKEASDGKLFKTILIDDLKDLETDKYVIRSADSLLAKVYIFRADVNGDIKEIYKLLKLRAAEGLNIEINETNEFGLASFYMNDKNRPQTAFLTVRIAGFVYGFAYPKEFHAQIKNLITLLEWEYN